MDCRRPRNLTHRAFARSAEAVKARRSVRGAVPVWVPLMLLFGGLFVGMRALQNDARQRGMAQVDVTRYRLVADSQWMSAAWTEELERILVEARALPIDDPAVIQTFVEEVEALPFVAEVGTYSVQWPDGLILPVRLHEPVACIRTGGRDFLPVAADGTVLGGYTYAPHEAYGGWLPTLGPHGLVEEIQGTLLPGDRIEVPEALSALSVADSMWGHLSVQDLRLLRRCVIDASQPDAPVVDRTATGVAPARLPGGVRINLEGGRRIFFGRPPIPLHDGELPVGYKWSHVREALIDADNGDEWALLDVRFDDPITLSRAEVEALVERSNAAGDQR